MDPTDLLAALMEAGAEAGVTFLENARVTGLHDDAGIQLTVRTAERQLETTADHVVIATGSPVLDRGRPR